MYRIVRRYKYICATITLNFTEISIKYPDKIKEFLYQC